MANRYVYTFAHKVAGIPAKIGILSYYPGHPAYVSGPPELCDPGDDSEVEWEVLDRRGNPAPWLEKKITEKEREKITQVAEDVMEYRRAEEEMERRLDYEE